MRRDLKSKIFIHIWFLTLLVAAGTVGYMVVAGWNFFDSLFMTVTTLATVGYGEVHPLSTEGRIYTIILILLGVGLLIYILSDLAEILVEANPQAIFGRRRMKNKIDKLTGHQIVCGFGRTGQEVSHHFKSEGIEFVVVEADDQRCKWAEQQGYLVLQGDATTDDVLMSARIDTARGIVCGLPDDASNTFITLAARGLNENITVVCRAANPGSEAKMIRAGARNVISPYVICGRRMAAAVTHPLVLEFLDVAMHSPAYDLRLEQVRIASGSPLVSSTLRDANIKQTYGAMVLAVKQSGKLITNPPPDLIFNKDDELIVLGSEEELKQMAKAATASNNELR